MAFYYDQVDSEGVVVVSRVRLLPNTPPPPPGHSWIPHVPNIASRREKVKQLIKELRDTKLANGGFKAQNKWFHSDTFSRSQQLGLIMLGANLPNNIDWKTMDGSFIRLTPQIVSELFAGAVAQDNSIFSYAEYLISLVMVSSNPENVNIDAGWPETYNGVQ